MTNFDGFAKLTGAALAGAVIGLSIVLVLTIIAMWKIFTKAGVEGWKSLIPIYNVYVLCKIVGISFWVYVIILPFVVGLIAGLFNNKDATSLINGIYTLCFDIFFSYKLAKAFGKSTGFTVGLVLLPTIFTLILGFDDSKYVGTNN